jgi:microcystin degradation protein MlrC
MPRIAIAGLVQETNTFSPVPTTYEDFSNQGGFYPKMLVGEEILRFKQKKVNIAASGFLMTAEKLGFEIIPLVWAGAEPAAPASEDIFNRITGRIIEMLRDQGPVDGVYLDLHGAMVFGDCQDAETEILLRVRQVIGDEIPLVASLDLHGNITPQSIELSSAMVGYRTYPHVDGFEAGERCAHVMKYLLDGGSFFTAFRQIPFLMPATRQPTTIDPCKSLYVRLDELEKEPGMISLTLMLGFNPVDIPDTGPSIFAYARTQALANQTAEDLYDAVLACEADFNVNLLTADEAVKRAMILSEEKGKPVILADLQDNAGGGSSSDTVWVLEALVNHNAQDAAVGLINDPDSAAAAYAAGEGTEIELQIGGKRIPGQAPFQGTFRVEKLYEGDFEGTGPMVKGRTLNLGKMAHLSIGGVHVVVVSDRMQALDQSFFRILGIEPAKMKILALKSANHYRADFGQLACEIINVDAPGGIVEDPSRVSYKNLRDGVRLKGLGPVYRKP